MGHRRSLFGGFALTFGDGLEAVDRCDRELLAQAAGPVDFEGFDGRCGADAEVGAHVGGGGVAAAGEDVSTLAGAVSGQVEGRADSVARRLGTTDEAEGYPVIFVGVNVAQERWRCIYVVDDGVHATVVEEVADGQAAGGKDLGEGGTFDCWHGFQAFAL